MSLGPPFGPIEEPGRHIALEGGVSAFLSDIEGDVPANQAAGDGACQQSPRIAAVRYKPQEQKISAARNRHGNDRGINSRDPEDSRHAQVRKPAERVMSSR